MKMREMAEYMDLSVQREINELYQKAGEMQALLKALQERHYERTREFTLANTKIEEAVMWAQKGIVG